MLINNKTIITENSKKFRQRKCPHHKVSYVQKVCTHSSCIESMAWSLLCNQCFRKHPENHTELIKNYLEFDKIFSENVFNDIELLENECLEVFLQKKQRMDAEIDKHCDIICEEVKQLVDSMKFRTKLKYSANDLVDQVLKLKESLQTEYNTLFSMDETNIKNQDIKQYLEFYLHYEKIFEQKQAKNEEIYEDIQKELNGISQLFGQKLKHIRSILESDMRG